VTDDGNLLNNTHTQKAVINGKTCDPKDDVEIDNNKKSVLKYGDWYNQQFGKLR
jgi:hypothetical protein